MAASEMGPAMRSPRTWRLILVVGAAIFAVAGAGGALDRSAMSEISAIYQPFRVEGAALAPDGRRLAFVMREGRSFEIEIFDLDSPKAKRRVHLEARSTAKPQFLAWTAPDQLVVAFDSPLIVAIAADIGATRTLVDARTFADDATSRRSWRVLGLPANDPENLLLELTGSGTSGEMEIELVRLNVRTGAQQRARIAELGAPGGAILLDRQGMPRVLWSRTEIPQRFRYRSPAAVSMGWRDLDRVVSEPGPLGFCVTPENLFGERSIPLGFDSDPAILYFASNLGRDTHGIFALDVRTGRRTGFAVEDPDFDLVDVRSPWARSPLVFDRAHGGLVGVRRPDIETGTWWLDAGINEVQKTLEKKFPGRHVQLLEWDHRRERFLALVTTNSDPGRYFMHHRPDGRCVEYLRRTPPLPPEIVNQSEPFTCATPAGSRITGYVTLPHAPPVARPALVVWLHDGPGGSIPSGFNRDAQALAAMGFLVAQVNYGGSAGHGRARHDALRGHLDGGTLAEVQAAIRWIETRHGFDPKRIALVGEGLGGFFALQALQKQPDAFRCAVAINAPVELGDLRRNLPVEQQARRALEADRERAALSTPVGESRADAAAARISALVDSDPPPIDFEHEFLRWFYGGPNDLGKVSVLRQAGLITQPVLLLHDSAQRYAPIASVRRLHADLEGRKREVAFAEIAPQFARGSLEARAQVMRQVGEFLNVTLYDFVVKLGEAREVK